MAYLSTPCIIAMGIQIPGMPWDWKASVFFPF